MQKEFTIGANVQRPYGINQMLGAQELADCLKKDGINIPIADHLDMLETKRMIGNKVIPNSIGIHPCEGFDASTQGDVSDLTIRRYRRYAEGGAGLIWFESFGIGSEGKDSPCQLTMLKENIPGVKALLEQTDAAAMNQYGTEHRPYKVIQLNHSGRRSVDLHGERKPICGWQSPVFDEMVFGDIPVADDEYIEMVIQQYIDAAENAMSAGFDGVDLKACHGYLLSDLMCAFERPGKYGGSFENRVRAIIEIVDGIRKKCGDNLDICIRMNAYDAIPYPYGWGMVKEAGVMQPDLTEPIALLKLLSAKGVKMMNITTHTPRFAPFGEGLSAQFNGKKVKPYYGVACLLNATKELRTAVPDMLYVATGLSWFEKYSVNVGAGGIEQGWFDIAGFGRQALAYPDFAKDIIIHKTLNEDKLCVLCDKCHELSMKGHTMVGCVIRDPEIYLPLYKEKVLKEDKLN